MDKLNKRIKSIYNEIDPNLTHLFINNKLIISGKNIKDIKEQLQKFENPSKDISVFIIRIKLNPKNNNVLLIDCTQQTLTTKLKLIAGEYDLFQNFTYSQEELIKYGFKLSHLKSMMKAIKNVLISFDKSSITFTELKNALK